VRPDDVLTLYVSLGKVHIFDPESGASISGAATPAAAA